MELPVVTQVVAGGYQDKKTGLEKVVVFASTDNKAIRALSEELSVDKAEAVKHALDKVREKINDVFGFSPDFLVSLKPGEIKKTTSGKLQRNQMIADYQNNVYAQTTFTSDQLIALSIVDDKIAPSPEPVTEVLNQFELQGKIEEVLKQGWSEVLKIPVSRIGLNDSFFHLGGNSIKAVEMIALAEEYTGCMIPQDIIANYQTISEIAGYIVSNSNKFGSRLSSIVSQSDETEHVKEIKPEEYQHTDNDIAIIGMACRFPGGYNLRRFWEVLTEGKNCISEIPSDRWNVDEFFDATGQEENKSYSKWGGFLEDIRHFDADFFKIKEEEARQMDPQQRLFLEIAWLAMENAGYIEPKDQQVGVFVGAGFNGYMENFINRMDVVDLHESTMTGNLTNMIAARVAHTYNLTGPALTIDTGCSSAMVALHLANKSILSGECDMALVGGIQLSLSSAPYVMFSKAGALSHGKLCNAFDQSSDGFIPGEGAGAIVVKSLKKAREDGDRIFSVIKGSAVNNDGRSLGIMAPSPQGQLAVIKQAYKNANVDPSTISYMEAHGTGSEISDLIELRSLSTAFNEAQAEKQQCAIGTVKNNIGHLLAASGIAALIKTSLSLYHKKLIPTINFKKAKSAIKFKETPFFVNKILKDWDTAHDKRRAAIHSFGFGGTNCHMILEESEQEVSKKCEHSDIYQIVTVSAHQKEALSKSIQDLQVFLANHQEPGLIDVCYSLNAKKAHFNEYRAAFITNSIPHLRLLLSEFQLDKTQGELERKKILSNHQVLANQTRKNPVFTFTGELCVYPGMGKMPYLLDEDFRNALEDCQQNLPEDYNESLIDLLVTYPREKKPLEDVINHQIAAFVFGYAMSQVWIKKGIEPGALLGFGVGDYIAACISQALTLNDALKLVYLRSQLMDVSKNMLVTLQVGCSLERFKIIIEDIDQQPKIFALNNGNSISITCKREGCDSVIELMRKNDISIRYLDISYSFDASKKNEFEIFSSGLNEIRYGSPVVPWISSYMGNFVHSQDHNKEYWLEHLTSLNSFDHGVQYIIDKDFKRFLEVGGSNHLTQYCSQVLDNDYWVESSFPEYTKNTDFVQQYEQSDADTTNVVSIKSSTDSHQFNENQAHFIMTVGKLYADGLNFKWDSCYYINKIETFDDAQLQENTNKYVDVSKGKLINIPTYPFQRKEAWVKQKNSQLNNLEHPYQSIMKQTGLGRYTITPDKNNPIFSRFNISSSLMPGIGQCELIAHSYRLAYGKQANVIHDLIFQKNWLDSEQVDIVFQQDNKKFYITPVGEVGAQFYCSGTIDSKAFKNRVVKDLGAIKERLGQRFSKAHIYDYFTAAGIDYGAFYRNIEDIFSSTAEVLSEIKISNEHRLLTSCSLNPGILDSAIQSFIGCHLANHSTQSCVFSPMKIDSMRVYEPLNDDVYYAHINRLMDIPDELIHCNIDICDNAGNVVVEIQNFTAQRIFLLEKDIENSSEKIPGLGLKQFLIYCIARILQIEDDEVDFNASFMEMDADSVSAVKLVKMLEEGIGVELYPTLLFEYSTVDSLYHYLTTVVDENITVDVSHVGRILNKESFSEQPASEEKESSDSDFVANDEQSLPDSKTVLSTASPGKSQQATTVKDESLTHQLLEQIVSLQKNIEVQREEHNKMFDKQLESIKMLISSADGHAPAPVVPVEQSPIDEKQSDDMVMQPVRIDNVIDMQEYIIALCAEKMKKSTSEIDIQKSFLEMGTDSIIALNIAKEIEKQLETELYPTILFEYPNIKELSDYLYSQYQHAKTELA